jgi:hypothetical protein
MFLALALVAAQAASALAGPAYRSEVPPQVFGVNASFYRAPPQNAGKMLDAIGASGISTVREGRAGNWAVVEPSPPIGTRHRYLWSTPDRVQEELASHGLHWYAYVGLAPSWDSAVLGGPPRGRRGRNDFTAYVTAFAHRYGRNGEFWRAHPRLPYLPVTDYELANEPSSPALHGAWTPAQLTRITRTAQSAIKAVDPRATVIPAAFNQTGPPDSDPGDAGSWLRAMLQLDPALRIDAVGVNLYRGAGGSGTLSAFETILREIRAELRRAGAGSVPIDVDEIGWQTRPNPLGITPVPPAERAANLSAMVTRWPLSNCKVRRLMPFIWSQGHGNPGEVPTGFALFTGEADDQPTISGAALTASIERAVGMGWLPPQRRRERIC